MFLLILLLIVGISVAFFSFWYQKRKKRIVLNTVVLITGAPKTCKSFLSVKFAISEHKKRLLKTKIYNFFHKNKKELPLLYSTIPLKYPHVMLTRELMLRKERFRYNSVIFVDEAYLVADGMCFQDQDVNENLSLFNKLIGHEMHGGILIYNTQNQNDVHYSIKRVAPSFLFILDKKKLPFFMLLKVREVVNSDEVPIYNTMADDVQSDPSIHFLLVSKKYFKYYDCYAYSEMTDDLPVAENVRVCESLKTNYIPNFKDTKRGGKKQ